MNPTNRRAARLYAVLVLATAAATLIPTLDAAGDELPCPDGERSARGYCPDELEQHDAEVEHVADVDRAAELDPCPDGFAPTGDPLYPCHDLASGPDPCTDEADTTGVPCPDTTGDDPVHLPDPLHDPEEPRHEGPEPAHEAEPEPTGDTTRDLAAPVQANEEPHDELPATGLPDPLLALIGGTMLAAGALILRRTDAGEVHP